MKRRTRYLVLGLGFLVFLTLGPVILLYVTGLRFDFENNRYLQTGIIAAKTEPKGATAYLDGQLVDTTPATLRFLKPAEYTLRIEKEGYLPWQKRLEVNPGKVTWANESLDKLYLLKQSPLQTIVATGVETFFAGTDYILYTHGTTATLRTGNGYSTEQQVSLMKPIDTIVPAESGKKLLLRGPGIAALFDVSTKKLSDLSSRIAASDSVTFLDDNALLMLHDGTLSMLSLQTLHTKALMTNVYSFTSVKDQLYALQNSGAGSRLVEVAVADVPQTDPLLLVGDLPRFSKAQLVVTLQKEVLLLGDETLYRIGSEAEQILSGVKAWGFDPENQSLWIRTSSELYNYDFVGVTPRFVSRSGVGFATVVMKPSFGYAFFSQDGQIKALELDNRDTQNNYVLRSAKNITALSVDSAAKTMFVLADGVLTTLEIR